VNAESPVEILLVEDNRYDAELAMRSLSRIANPIKLVEDGEEALEFVFGTGRYAGRGLASPKVVFLDLKLPKVDGLEVLRHLKGDPRTRAIPVVVLTSSREESDLVRSYDLGANSYIVKPMDFEKFSDSVSQLGLYWLLLNERPH
jgi:two-component system response regulator